MQLDMLLLFLYLTFMAPEVILVCPRAREGTDDTRAGGAAVAVTTTRSNAGQIAWWQMRSDSQIWGDWVCHILVDKGCPRTRSS